MTDSCPDHTGWMAVWLPSIPVGLKIWGRQMLQGCFWLYLDGVLWLLIE